MKIKKILFPGVISAILIILFYGCETKESKLNEYDAQLQPGEAVTQTNEADSAEGYAVEPPPFSEDIFPCSQCHDYIEPNPVRRELTDMHVEISEMFDHDKKNRWCLDCHESPGFVTPGQWKIAGLQGIVQIVRTMPWRQAEGLESRCAWQKNRHVER